MIKTPDILKIIEQINTKGGKKYCVFIHSFINSDECATSCSPTSVTKGKTIVIATYGAVTCYVSVPAFKILTPLPYSCPLYPRLHSSHCLCVRACEAALHWAKLGYTIRMPHFPLWEWGKSRTLIILYIASCNHRPVESRRAVWGLSLIQYHWIINGKLISMFGPERRKERAGKGRNEQFRFLIFLHSCVV